MYVIHDYKLITNANYVHQSISLFIISLLFNFYYIVINIFKRFYLCRNYDFSTPTFLMCKTLTKK